MGETFLYGVHTTIGAHNTSQSEFWVMYEMMIPAGMQALRLQTKRRGQSAVQRSSSVRIGVGPLAVDDGLADEVSGQRQAGDDQKIDCDLSAKWQL
jgi:hypothetical protein